MSTTPQFGTAKYKSASGPDRCKSCNQELAGNYFRINGLLACEKCASQLQAQAPKDTHSAFVRGIIFGTGGAIVGLALYAAFEIATGLIIGYIALAVGWLVGTAIKKGSGGIGGRRYQIAAVALTYAAVSLAAIPVGIAQIIKARKATPNAVTAPAQAAPNSASDPNTPESDTPSRPPAAPAPVNAIAVIGELLFAGLTSPFLELSSGVSGIIGLVILFVGVNIAWKMTGAAKLEILGPFKATAPPASPAI